LDSGGSLNTARGQLSRSWYSNSRISIWWYFPANTGATEEYDGTSWTSQLEVWHTARNKLAGAGTQTAGLGLVGYTTVAAATEEFTGAGLPTTKTITVS
jgi:hypothetical protein